jgi:pseudouridine synthase
MQERLQKILSARGIASRRKAEEYITKGLVTVNGKPAILGQKADPEVDTIEVDGRVLQSRKEMLYYLLYKPVGVVTSNVSRGGDATNKKRGSASQKTTPKKPGISPERLFPTVRDLLPASLRGKLFPVGRLDKDSEGLLLLTNDGVLAYRLTHPKFDHVKEYRVELVDEIFDGALEKLKKGMIIEGQKTKAAEVTRRSPHIFHIALTEGKNRQIRRMCEKVGSCVKKLTRVRIGPLADPALASGQLRPLTPSERTAILTYVGV